MQALLGLRVVWIGSLLRVQFLHRQPSNQLASVSAHFPIEVPLNGSDGQILLRLIELLRCLLISLEDPLEELEAGSDHLRMLMD